MRQICTLLFVLLSVFVNAQTPTVPASNIRFSSIDGGSFSLAFDIGNGTNQCLVSLHYPPECLTIAAQAFTH